MTYSNIVFPSMVPRGWIKHPTSDYKTDVLPLELTGLIFLKFARLRIGGESGIRTHVPSFLRKHLSRVPISTSHPSHLSCYYIVNNSCCQQKFWFPVKVTILGLTIISRVLYLWANRECWQGMRESNSQIRNQNPMLYHLTNPQQIFLASPVRIERTTFEFGAHCSA